MKDEAVPSDAKDVAGITAAVNAGTYLIDGKPPTGAMIALVPDEPNEYCIEGGEPPEALHITSKYLGKADDWSEEAREELRAVVESMAATTPPIELKCSSVEMFGEDHDCVSLEFESPAATSFHKVMHALTPEVELKWPEYKPHMALRYIKDGDDEPDLDELKEQMPAVIPVYLVRVAFGDDVTDYPLHSGGILAAVGDGEVTDAEREQRRQAALKSAEARRKKALGKYDEVTSGKDAGTRGNSKFFIESSNENSIRELRKKLQNPQLSSNERVMLQTALEIELENRRALKVKQAELRARARESLRAAEQELAYYSRVFDVDRMKIAQAAVDKAKKEVEAMALGDEISSINFEMKRESEREAARAAAEARREEATRLREYKKRQSEAKKARDKTKSAGSKPKGKGKKKGEAEEVLSASEKATLLREYAQRHSS